jgi:hypothetical protein
LSVRYSPIALPIPDEAPEIKIFFVIVVVFGILR